MGTLTTKRRGSASEAIAMAVFLARGWAVSVPWGDNERYDLVIDRGNGLERVQVKTGRLRGGSIRFNGYSNDHYAGRHGYVGDIDLFAVVAGGNVYLCPISDFLGLQHCLRVEPPKNGQVKKIKYAKEYLCTVG